MSLTHQSRPIALLGSNPVRLQRRTVPVRSAFFLQAAVAVTFLAASSAPSPLYRSYQDQWGISSVGITIVFAAYALSLLVALLTVGSLSDYIGRRRVILAAVALEIVSMLIFIMADGQAWLITARILQGFATGAATAALGAGLTDTHPTKAPVVNSVAPVAGMAIGALTAALLVTFAPAPTRLIYTLLVGLLLLELIGCYFLPDQAPHRTGALASLRPRITVPVSARAPFKQAVAILISVWALGGYFLSIGPTMAAALTGTSSVLTGGVLIFLLTAAGALAIFILQRQQPVKSLVIGGFFLVGGVSTTLAGLNLSSMTMFFLGTVLSGVGFGAGFLGSMKTILPRAEPSQRGGLLAAFYIVSYLAMGVPAVLAGLLVDQLGIHAVSTIFGIVIVLLSLSSLIVIARAHPGSRKVSK